MDIIKHNSNAWDKQVRSKSRWTLPVSPTVIEKARKGQWEIILTPVKPVPAEWLANMKGRSVLCLASGGGQQGPVLAAAGARVTVFDNSDKQLQQDRYVAERDRLDLETVKGDMRNLSIFSDNVFDLIIHPVSNCFVPDILPVWRECYRVLKPGGALLAGFFNPAYYIFDTYLMESRNQLNVRHTLPYADTAVLSEREKARFAAEGIPFEFGHTLTDQIGGQLKAGFVISGFYEDVYNPEEEEPLSVYMPVFIATRALKPAK